MKRKCCTMNGARHERSPDCVTVTRVGGVAVTVKGDSRHNAEAGEAMARGTARHGGAEGYADTS